MPIHEAVNKIVNFAQHHETEKALQEANARNNTRTPTFIHVSPVMDREMLQNLANTGPTAAQNGNQVSEALHRPDAIHQPQRHCSRCASTDHNARTCCKLLNGQEYFLVKFFKAQCCSVVRVKAAEKEVSNYPVFSNSHGIYVMLNPGIA
jgi:hypothetical protein